MLWTRRKELEVTGSRREQGNRNATQFRNMWKDSGKINRCKGEIIMEKGIKNCWISTLSTNLIFYYYQCNKLEIKQLLKKKSVVMMKNKGKTTSVNQTTFAQNHGLIKEQNICQISVFILGLAKEGHFIISTYLVTS